MSYRISSKDLDTMTAIINRMTFSPDKPWETVDGRNIANVGNYHISGANGGVCLHRMVNTSGGVSDVFLCGHVPKRKLYDLLCAYIEGLREGEKLWN